MQGASTTLVGAFRTYLARPPLRVALAAAAALASSVLWYLNSPAAVEVAQAEEANDGGIIATVHRCGVDLSVEVYEDDSLVIITVFDHRFRIWLSGDDCQNGIRVPLSVPLGRRMLTDGSTGRLLIPSP
ncbi:MAG TPA: hypothetical protein VJR05_11475 [Acidimicrobiia bacterium]|nr:hypothetical protein [Acidimicrobiia bacterium]